MPPEAAPSPAPHETAPVCVRCGTRLTGTGKEGFCLNCLLLDRGLDEDSDGDGQEHVATVPEENAKALAAPSTDNGRAPAPRRLEHYEIVTNPDGTSCELGRGAMGVTYKAFDTNLRCHVALKVIHTRYLKDELARERFLREARAAAQLRHPNVASVFHLGCQDSDYFYAMELVEGETVEARVKRDGPLAPALALEITAQVARALVAASKRELIHRDLKPSNLMLCTDDDGTPVVKVIDFGLAKPAADLLDLTQGVFVGTPRFASPEQFAREDLDTRSDIYSLGVTLWFLLTGRLPFRGSSLAEIHEQQRQANLPVEGLRGVPAPAVALLKSMLAVDPAQRPQNAYELLSQVENCLERVGGFHRRGRPGGADTSAGRWKLATAALAALLLGLLSLPLWLPHRHHPPPAAGPVSEKSIAVLPFDNLSADQENAYFADGIQDDILTNLARIGDLKVISRTSVLQYRGATRNLREIGRQLGVAHILEGSVRRIGNRVRVSAQLINAQTDAHLWAETFDRDMTDLFGIQSELSARIAAALQANLSPTEKAAMNRKPTADAQAYELYLKARNLFRGGSEHQDREVWERGLRLAQEAVARDPNFTLGHCLVAWFHDDIYWLGFERTPQRLAQAKAAIDTALRLDPNLGEAHMALAYYYYHGFRDYDRARAELAIARQTMPNNAELFTLHGLLDRRQGRWEESVVNLRRARELDPRNVSVATGLTENYLLLGRYAELSRAAAEASECFPDNPQFLVLKGWADSELAGNFAPMHAAFRAIPTGEATRNLVTVSRLELCLLERNFSEAERVLAAAPDEIFDKGDHALPKAVYRGLLAQARGDVATARADFAAARQVVEKRMATRADDPLLLSGLGYIDALLGRKEEAIHEGRRAVELMPISRDALEGCGLAVRLAAIYAQVGERDEAFAQLEALRGVPGAPSSLMLRSQLEWEPLRGDPRFEKLLVSASP